MLIALKVALSHSTVFPLPSNTKHLSYGDEQLLRAWSTGSGFDLAWLSCRPSTSVYLVYLVLYLQKNFDYVLFFTFWCAEPVELALDLEDYHSSVILHCWLGHMAYKIVCEMTYNVSSGTLNPAIPYTAM